MEHLNLEALARLVDGRPNPKEREHVASCSDCASELRALKLQTEALSGLPVIRPPRGDWHSVEARLLGEGLISTTADARRPWSQRIPVWGQAAAAVLFFLGGIGVGGSFSQPAELELENTGLAQAVRSMDDALELVNVTERVYMDALVRYNQLSRPESDMSQQEQLERLAAYEGLLSASQQAVRMAPSDPVFNGFLANVVAERQSALRMVSTGRENY